MSLRDGARSTARPLPFWRRSRRPLADVRALQRSLADPFRDEPDPNVLLVTEKFYRELPLWGLNSRSQEEVSSRSSRGWSPVMSRHKVELDANVMLSERARTHECRLS